MKITLLAAGAFALVLAMPLGVYAQQGPPPASQAYGRTMPSESKLQHRWAKRFGNLNLSGDQQQRIQSLIHQYSQAHPQGSPRDRDAERAQMQQRQMQGQGQGPGNPGYQQGQPPQQYQQGPPDQQGPPQQYQQGPPDQQGPPPDQQGPPPDQQPPPQGQGPPGPPPA